MKNGKFNILLDAFHGSSGKGKISTYLANECSITNVSSANFPNAGHSAVFSSGTKFVAKAIPTAAILNKECALNMKCYISPGSGFSPYQLFKEWFQAEKPKIFIHSRASIVTKEHARREQDGKDSTKHIASTMQGSGAAIVDKILRKPDCLLVTSQRNLEFLVQESLLNNEDTAAYLQSQSQSIDSVMEEFSNKVQVVEAFEFRNLTHSVLESGSPWLHEGSQGYALSIDHGNEYPYTTSRNCTTQTAMDYMAIPPSFVGDVYLNLRTYPIRVGNVVENGVNVGYSGSFYPDSTELTWFDVARMSGMPKEEAIKLAEKERTTVTKRIRRVSTFSFIGLKDSIRTNGATKLALNFIQYINWKDAGLSGGKEAFLKLSKESREFISKIEEASNIPVTLIGTGPLNNEIIDLAY